MDDKARKAEELLQERLRTRTNGEPHGAVADAEPEAAATADARAVTVKVEELTNDLKRMTADFANYRKRNDAERIDFAKFAKAELIARLLDVLDGYDRALATVPDDIKGQPWVEGMWLVERKLRSILEAEGLEPIDSLGDPFDPYLHQAVAHIESDRPEGTVIEEHQKAYRLHDRVIRPALVTVAKKKE
ncbi:MAG: nucleotide exchange factor GrpE [Chloroflexota bacterium]